MDSSAPLQFALYVERPIFSAPKGQGVILCRKQMMLDCCHALEVTAFTVDVKPREVRFAAPEMLVTVRRASNALCFCAQKDGRTRAFAHSSDLFVEPTARQRGVASLMMRDLFSWSRLLFAGSVFHDANGIIGTLSSIDAATPEARRARERFYTSVCGWAHRDNEHGNGYLMFDAALTASFARVDSKYRKVAEVAAATADEVLPVLSGIWKQTTFRALKETAGYGGGP
jgi:hypothetical protein